MKKVYALFALMTICLSCFSSCVFSSPQNDGRNHTYEYVAYESCHFKQYTCGCPSPEIAELHYDNDKNGMCDACEYICGLSADVAQIVIDYERQIKNNIKALEKEHPENIYYYHPVDQVHCTYILKSTASAEDLVEKYNMNGIFAKAEVSALNAIKMISVIFQRDDFTEAMHQRIMQVSEEESQIENLFIDMERKIAESYMPKIGYYSENPISLSYTTTDNLLNMHNGYDFLIKSKEEYNEYLDLMSELDENNYLDDMINNQRDLYDESFFEENALIITKIITRGSGSIKLTVHNLYISSNTVYIVIKTDEPTIGTCDMQYATFTFIVPKNEVVNATEVITLE